jgi:hypothetical protein
MNDIRRLLRETWSTPTALAEELVAILEGTKLEREREAPAPPSTADRRLAEARDREVRARESWEAPPQPPSHKAKGQGTEHERQMAFMPQRPADATFPARREDDDPTESPFQPTPRRPHDPITTFQPRRPDEPTTAQHRMPRRPTPPPPAPWQGLPRPRPIGPADVELAGYSPPPEEPYRPGYTYPSTPHHAVAGTDSGLPGQIDEVLSSSQDHRTTGLRMGNADKTNQPGSTGTNDHDTIITDVLAAFLRMLPELRLPFIWPSGGGSGTTTLCGVVAGPTQDGTNGRETPIVLYPSGPMGAPADEPVMLHVPQLHPDDSLVKGMWVWGIVTYPSSDPDNPEDLYFAQPPVWCQGPVEGEPT